MLSSVLLQSHDLIVSGRHKKVNSVCVRADTDSHVSFAHTIPMLFVWKLRREKGWSQEKLAEVTGLGRSWLSRLETGEGNFSRDNLLALAKGLGVSVHELFGYSHPPDVTLTDMQRDVIKIVGQLDEHHVRILLAAACAMLPNSAEHNHKEQ